jgi:hypothetical protein
MFIQGLMLAIIFIIWMIPVILLACVQGVTTGIFADSYDAQGFVGFISVCFGCLNFLWGIVVALAAPAIIGRYAQTGDFGTAFKFGEIWNFTSKNFGNVIVVVLLGWVASLIGSLGVILCLIGVFLTYFWAVLVQGHLYGQLFLETGFGEPEAVEVVEA